ncbi:MAG: DUF2202 domain-containing protein [Methanothrix sp.]
MKRIFLCSLCLLLFAASIWANASDQDLLISDGESSSGEVNETALVLALAGEPSGELTRAEVDGLLFMIEEEKLAVDVYSALDEKWDMRVFENIGRAELTHQAAVKRLLDRYSLQDPRMGVGEFANETLQDLYNDLLAQGSVSVRDALMAGAAIEEIDILDLEEYMAQTDKEDILLVYANLLRGSENHLRAFANNLERQRVEYTPQYLSEEEYRSIMEA